jgi:murein DD-endopeptidase MepM/ murein hydrolase activator NlpD
MKKSLFLILLILIGFIILFILGKINFSKPEITVLNKTLSLGENAVISVKAVDDKPGIRDLKVYISQNNHKIKVFEQSMDNQKDVSLNVNIKPKSLGLVEGNAVLEIEARDGSILKNTKVLTKDVKIDFTPPSISILASTQNIINGGTGFVFAKSSEDLKSLDIKIENLSFKCLNLNNTYVCPFSLPYFYNDKKPIYLEALDNADNKTVSSIPYNFKKVNYSQSILDIDDNFIDTKIKPLSDKDIPDKTELFKYVNTVIRNKNESLIHKIASECKNVYPMFEGEFLYLENAAKLGGFADYRKYRYNGKIIEGADAYHKGFDFASVKNAPVKASNNGKVVFTGFLGIYGNSVIIDHGLCVYTLYSHLSEIAVKEGETVKKGQYIGKTGTTGLAVGDHLHYGVLVNGIEVNPVEWFDINWLNTRFYENYKNIIGGNR